MPIALSAPQFADMRSFAGADDCDVLTATLLVFLALKSQPHAVDW
jgi:hypothetical protein